MSILKVAKLGHPILLKKAIEIKDFSSDSLKNIIYNIISPAGSRKYKLGVLGRRCSGDAVWAPSNASCATLSRTDLTLSLIHI